MPEGEGRPEMLGAAPDYLGAVFKQGNKKNQVIDWSTHEMLVPVFDVEKRSEREQWIVENMRVFLDGTVANPEQKWKPIIDTWLSDLRFAAKRTGLNREALQETEDDLKAIMAICSSARAMEASAGTATTYIEFITQTGRGGNLEVQDTWSDFLLHKDADKLKRVVTGFEREPKDEKKGEYVEPRILPLVKHFYDKLVADTGIELYDDRITIKGEVDKNKALFGGKLIDYLRRKNPFSPPEGGETEDKKKKREEKLGLWEAKKGKDSEEWEPKHSLNDYIAEVLLGQETEEFKSTYGDIATWTAAKVAADAFLVNLYTQWEFGIDRDGDLSMKPIPTWGGDPFRGIIEPSFLPRKIKSMYESEADSVILDLVDLAFRPSDLCKDESLDKNVREKIEKKLLKPSATTHLKFYARYNNALWAFFGESSRAAGIPQWSRDTTGKYLPSIIENLDQVIGGIGVEGTPNLGKQVEGLMIMRLIHCKALAVTLESGRPGFLNNLGTLFGGDPKERPFFEVRQFLYGPHLNGKDGFFASLGGARTRIALDSPLFKDEIEARWQEVWDLFLTNDQTPGGRRQQKAVSYLGFGLAVLSAFAPSGGGKKR